MNVTGISGSIAKAFIRSKLTPIIVGASLLLGVFATMITPREEEPQIVVPMVDVMVAYPGASAAEVEARVTKPLERLLWELKGVEYVYSIARPGQNLTIVRFYVGEDMEASMVKLYTKLMANFDVIPAGVSQPIIKARSIDDVPVLAVTLWGKGYNGFDLRRIGTQMADHLKKNEAVSEINVIGGQRRQLGVELDPARLAAHGTSSLEIMGALQKTNLALPAGELSSGNRTFTVEAGGLLKNAEDAGRVVIGVQGGRPVYLGDVAKLTDGPEEASSYVFMDDGKDNATREAVTIALSKKKGENATTVAEDALKKIEAMRGTIIPSDVQITTTRNYGETAKDKSDELLKHMLIATISVIILIAFTLGWKESIVVAVAVPVTLALTLLVNYLLGYTLNRVTLFALIFSIGILVDDAIVVVENIHRHFKMKGASPLTAILAVDEVGNPTILATFTVIAALLPMAFVRGLMGPYMKPIPIGASAAMLFSLAVAFIVSPWLGYIVLKRGSGAPSDQTHEHSALYERIMRPLIDNPRKQYIALGVILGLLGLAMTLVPLKGVTVKMLPFDNKSEFQVIIDMPEGSTLEQTTALGQEMAHYLRTVPEVRNTQLYSGTSAPYNFNGLVRHYFLRRGPESADIQVNLAPKDERKAQSHEIAKRVRPSLKALADKYGAHIKVAEIPPGPPVLSTLVAEVYGPDTKRQVEIARDIKQVFETTDGVVDTDWFYEDDKPKLDMQIDAQKAALSGVSVEDAARSLRIALAGGAAGLMHEGHDEEPVEIFLRMPQALRTSADAIAATRVRALNGMLVPLSSLLATHQTIDDKAIYHKNLRRVTYVTADVAGTEESPLYAIMKMKAKIKEMKLPEGYELKQYSSEHPWLEDKYAMKWDGEWHITYEVFRDLGIAFAAVLVLIYILVLAWFRSFITPLVIMSPIPLTLVGILPGHWMFGAFFTATSMIGFIALAGIIVRNSILLVDFIEMEIERGSNVSEAVITAGSVRLRPIVLTAAAVVVGSFVMLFDPIFQGLAISMMFGAVAATGLTLVAVPLLYYRMQMMRRTDGKAPDNES